MPVLNLEGVMISDVANNLNNYCGVSNDGKPEWECHLFGRSIDSEGSCISLLVVTVKDEIVPNWFWRKMQWLLLGTVWRKKQCLK